MSADLPSLLSDEVAADPHAFYAELRDRDEIPLDPLTGSYLLSRFDDCLVAYRDARFTTGAYAWQLEPVHGRTIVQMDGREHGTKRQILSRSFRGEALQALEPKITGMAIRIMEEATYRAAKEMLPPRDSEVTFDFMEKIARRLPVAVIAYMLDIPEDDYPRFVRWYGSVIRVLANLARDPLIMEEGRSTRAEISQYFAPVVEERRGSDGRDLISILCHPERSGAELTTEEIISYCSFLLVAGAETTDRALGSLMLNLLSHPDQLECVKADRRLVTAAIAESLRLSPPSQMNSRELSEEVEIAGQALPHGAAVTVILASANRDPRRFDRPDTYDIARSDLATEKVFSGVGEALTFGAGRHYCLGAALAKVEMEIVLNLILDRFPGIRLDPDSPPPFETGVKMRSPELLVLST